MSSGAIPRAVFTEGSTMRHVLVMTAATSVGLMAIFAVDLLSLLYVSRLGDPKLTAAVGFATQVLFFSVSINIGLSIAIGALVSRAIGAGDGGTPEDLRHLDWCMSCSSQARSVAWHGPCGGKLLLSLGHQRNPRRCFELSCNHPSGNSFSRSRHGARQHIAGGWRRAALDVRNSFGRHRYSRARSNIFFGLGLGVYGAAIVTLISRFVLVAVGLHGAVLKHNLVARPDRAPVAIRDWPAMMGIAVPAILTNLATPFANAYSMRVFSHFGEGIVAAFRIDRINPMAFGVLFALSGSVRPVSKIWLTN